jgi:hypothetical protein
MPLIGRELEEQISPIGLNVPPAQSQAGGTGEHFLFSQLEVKLGEHRSQLDNRTVGQQKFHLKNVYR